YGYRIHEITEMQVADMGNYAHGNQPAQHMLYLYDWTSELWKGQLRIRETMDRLYSATPDGYCGDEDNGQTSAWYVFSALGFYPVCPGSGQYAIGTPLFPKAEVSLSGGKTLTITASDPGPMYDDIRLNGKRLDGGFLDVTELRGGAKLQFK
ncbi:MAG: glycoside hydrolase family 92 protein, partial [Bacteroidales bacterium]|nr:glycoside hydrolase family 92 protein [Bacteroidales bacterium]